MKKKVLIIALSLFSLAATVLAATTDFTADGNITVAGVTFGSGTADMLILNESTAESWNFNGGAFTVTNPGSAFRVGSSDSDVKSVVIKNSSTNVNVACAENIAPGTTYVTLPTTAATYTVTPSTATDCTALCPAVSSLTNVATYVSFPTCAVATCQAGYMVSGSTCALIGGGGPSGGGSVSIAQVGLASPSPSPSPSPTATASPSPSPSPSPAAAPAAPAALARPVAPASGSTPGQGIASIKEGGLIRPANDFRVYIVKGGYARWIQNPQIFSIYKHFKASDVKVISGSDLTKYTEASLVRAKGDYKVWEVNGDGSKHWINMTAQQFSQSGRKWDMVYEVNPAEAKLYKTGADVMK